MNGVYDAPPMVGKKGKERPHPPAKLELCGKQVGPEQANGIGTATCSERQHHPLSQHANFSHPLHANPGGTTAPNNWALVWDVGAKAGAAAAAAAAAAARGRLGQWARLRREARGGGLLPSGEIEALGHRYNCLEHDFEGFKQKWPALQAEAASRRALRRVQSARPPVGQIHSATVTNPAAIGHASQCPRPFSRPRTAPSIQHSPDPSSSKLTPGCPGASTPERHAVALTSNGQHGGGIARMPVRVPSPAYHKLAQLAPSHQTCAMEHLPHQRHNAHQLPTTSNTARMTDCQHALPSNHLHPAPTTTACVPKRPRPSSQLPTNGPCQERAETGRPAHQPHASTHQHEPYLQPGQPMALLAPLRAEQRQAEPLPPPSPSTPHCGGTAAVPNGARSLTTYVGPPQPCLQQQQQQQQQAPTSNGTAAPYVWQLEGGTPASSPFSQPQLMDDNEDEDDEDPFLMPTFVATPRTQQHQQGAAGGAAHLAPSHHQQSSTAPLRNTRQSTELLLPSLGSVKAMLAATSNPTTPRTAHKSVPYQPHAHGHLRASAGSSCQLIEQEDCQQQREQEQQVHAQHIRLMQRRLIQEQRRLDSLQAAAAAIMPQGATGAGACLSTALRATAPTTLHLRHSPPIPLAPPAPCSGVPGAPEHARQGLAQESSSDGVRSASSSPFCSNRLQGEGAAVAHTPPAAGRDTALQRKHTTSRIPSWALPPQSTSPSSAATPVQLQDSGGDRPRSSGRLRVMAMAAALSEAHQHVRGQVSPTSPAAGTKIGKEAAAAAAAAAGRGAKSAAKSETGSAGSKVKAGGAAYHRPQANATPPSSTTTTKPRSTSHACATPPPSVPSSATRHAALSHSKVRRVPRAATTSPVAASAAATPSHSRKPQAPGPLRTKTSVGRLASAPHPLTRHTSYSPDPAAAALAAAAASLSTARSRSGLSNAAACWALSAASSAASSAQHSPRPSHTGALSPNQTPLPPRPRTHVHRPSSTSGTPAFATPCDADNAGLTTPFCTPPSRPSSNGRAAACSSGSSKGGRRSSSGVPGGHNYVLRLQREARARHAAAAADAGTNLAAAAVAVATVTSTDATASAAPGLDLIPSTFSPSASMLTARSTEASTPDVPPHLHPHFPRPRTAEPCASLISSRGSCGSGSSAGRSSSGDGGSGWKQQAGRRVPSPLMRSVPTNITSSPGACTSSTGWGGCAPGNQAEDLLPLKQLSAMRSMRQSRLSAASSVSSTAAASQSAAHCTRASPSFHSPLLKSRTSDNSALHTHHQHLHHHHHHSPHQVTFALPPSSSSGQQAHASSTTPLTNGRPPFRLSNGNPLRHSNNRRSPSPSPLHSGPHWDSCGRLAGGTRASPPPPCTPLPFQALQSKSFTAGGVHTGETLAAARAAAIATATAARGGAEAAAGLQLGPRGSHHHLAHVLQPQSSRPSFDTTTREALDADADVELVSRSSSGSSSSSYQSQCGSLHFGNSSGPLTPGGTVAADDSRSSTAPVTLTAQGCGQGKAHATASAAEAVAAARTQPAHPHGPSQPQHSSQHQHSQVTSSPAKAVASYWSRLFSRQPSHRQATATATPAGVAVGERV